MLFLTEVVAALDLVPFKSGVAHPEGLWGKTEDLVLRGHSRSSSSCSESSLRLIIATLFELGRRGGRRGEGDFEFCTSIVLLRGLEEDRAAAISEGRKEGREGGREGGRGEGEGREGGREGEGRVGWEGEGVYIYNLTCTHSHNVQTYQ